MDLILYLISHWQISPVQEGPPPRLLAWCSEDKNQITITDLETNLAYSQFDGAQLKNKDGGNISIYKKIFQFFCKGYWWSHVREIPVTTLLVSLHHSYEKCARMEIFDVSKKEQAKKVFSSDEVLGGK